MRIKLFALSKESESSESSNTPLVEVNILYTEEIFASGCYCIKYKNEFNLVQHLPCVHVLPSLETCCLV